MVVLLFKGNVLFATGSDTFTRNPEASNFSLNGTSRPGLVFPGISVRVGLGGEMCTGFGEEIDDTCNKLESLKIKKKQTKKKKLHYLPGTNINMFLQECNEKLWSV